MTDEQIYCPNCNHLLRVPVELLGQPVECPQCRARFTAPVRADAPPVLPAPRDAADFAPAYADDSEALAHRGRARLTTPAIFLMVIGVLSALMNGYLVVSGLYAQANPAEWNQLIQFELDKHPEFRPQQRQQFEGMFAADAFGPKMVLFGGLSLALAILTLLGSIAMLTRRLYVLAILGAAAALNPVNCCCLDLNIPFAIWALVVLLSRDGRAAFH